MTAEGKHYCWGCCVAWVDWIDESSLVRENEPYELPLVMEKIVPHSSLPPQEFPWTRPW
jgi:hypothetical protein